MKPTLFALLLLAIIVPTLAAERIAFVVGVDTYTKLAPEAQLKVAVSDAERMAGTLEALDPPFQVTLLKDTDWKTAQEKFDTFLSQAKDAECALVYFAGHGIEYHGENFLLVKDTDVSDISSDVERMKRRLSTAAVSLQGWVDSLDSTRAQVKLVILDCCRNNPLKADDGAGSRSVVGGSRGLAQVTPPSGTLISYSADAGQQANDGLFTEVLTNNLKAPGLNIVKVFAKTREEVREISESWAAEDSAKGLSPQFRRPRHEPAEYNKLNLAGTDFAFMRGVPVAVKAEPPVSAMSFSEFAALNKKIEILLEEAEAASNTALARLGEAQSIENDLSVLVGGLLEKKGTIKSSHLSEAERLASEVKTLAESAGVEAATSASKAASAEKIASQGKVPFLEDLAKQVHESAEEANSSWQEAMQMEAIANNLLSDLRSAALNHPE